MARTSTPQPRSPSPPPGPHPLTPSPRGGEGERTVSSSSPLSALRRGGQGVRTKVREGEEGEDKRAERGTGGKDSKGGQGLRIRRAQKVSFTRRLLAWWARAARELPWRRTRDPYRVLVSEFMLQQTQVSRVAEYYPRFLDRFPDLETLARARPRAVREAWEGLGYYARARNLHSLAKQVSDAGGQVPDDPAELAKLPG